MLASTVVLLLCCDALDEASCQFSRIFLSIDEHVRMQDFLASACVRWLYLYIRLHRPSKFPEYLNPFSFGASARSIFEMVLVFSSVTRRKKGGGKLLLHFTLRM